MKTDPLGIAGVNDGLYGGGARALLPVQRHVPPHAALQAVEEPQGSVEGDADGGGGGGFVEGAGSVREAAIVDGTIGDAVDGAVCPLRVVGVGVDQGIAG